MYQGAVCARGQFGSPLHTLRRPNPGTVECSPRRVLVASNTSVRPYQELCCCWPTYKVSSVCNWRVKSELQATDNTPLRDRVLARDGDANPHDDDASPHDLCESRRRHNDRKGAAASTSATAPRSQEGGTMTGKARPRQHQPLHLEVKKGAL